MKFTDYFTISHYLPEGVHQRNKEMAKYLRNAHFCKRGLHQKEAEQNFIKYVQEMKEYGLHLYSAVWVSFAFKYLLVYLLRMLEILVAQYIYLFLYAILDNRR